MSKLKKLSLLFLLLSTGCVIQNITSTNPINKEEISSNNNLNQNNFDVLTEEVTAIPTKKPWTLELPSPTPVPPNEPVIGIAYAEFNHVNGYDASPFSIKTNNQRLVAPNNRYVKVNREKRKIELVEGLAIEFSYDRTYTTPKCCYSTKDLDGYDSINGKIKLELDSNNSEIIKPKNEATASIYRRLTHYGGAFCYYTAILSSALNPSGSLRLVNNKLYADIDYKSTGYWRGSDTLCGGLEPKYTDPNFKSGNAHVSFTVDVPKIPVDLQLKVDDINGKSNQIISPANQDKKYDKADLLITTMDYDEWVLIAEGKDVYGNTRRYMEEGKGNKDIEFKGKTNDASNAENDMYFADGVVQITLTSKKSGETSGGDVLIDNTPPEVKVNSVSIKGTNALIDGVVVDKFPENEKLTKIDSAVSGLDETTIPKNINMYEKNVSLETISTQSNSSFSISLSNIDGLNDENADSFKDEIENMAGAVVEDSVEDKVGNVALPINFNFQAEMNDKDVEPLFEAQSFNTKLDISIAQRIISNAKKYKPNIVLWRRAPYIGPVMESFNLGFRIGNEILRKQQDKCLNRINSEPVNVGVSRKYEIGSSILDESSSLVHRMPFHVKSKFNICDPDNQGQGYAIEKFSTSINNTIMLERDRTIIATNKTIFLNKKNEMGIGERESSTSLVELYNSVGQPIRWYGSMYYPDQFTVSGTTNTEKMIRYAQPPFAVNGGYNARTTIKNVYSIKTGLLVRRYGIGTSGTFNVLNKHPFFNKKFMTSRNPYPISDEKKLHIKIRHSLNILNPMQFVKAYTSKFADDKEHRKAVIKQFTKKEASEAYKSSCWKREDMKNNENEIFSKIREIAEMTDINDYWKGDTETYLIIAGKRKIAGKEQIIDVLFDRKNNYLFGSSFPDDTSKEALHIILDSNGNVITDKVKDELINKMTEGNLEDSFNDYLKSPLIETRDVKQSFNSAINKFLQYDIPNSPKKGDRYVKSGKIFALGSNSPNISRAIFKKELNKKIERVN